MPMPHLPAPNRNLGPPVLVSGLGRNDKRAESELYILDDHTSQVLNLKQLLKGRFSLLRR